MSQYLDDIYASLPSGSDASPEDREAVDATCGEGAATYGEIEPNAASRLLRWLKLEKDDCFVDCGSGTGRLVLQSIEETNVGQAVGIEMSEFRHQIATQARAQTIEGANSSARFEESQFVLGDFRDNMPPLASVVYAGSLCFPPELMSALAAQVHSLPRFRALCTLKPLSRGWTSKIRDVGELDLAMTWSKNNRLYIYGPKRI